MKRETNCGVFYIMKYHSVIKKEKLLIYTATGSNVKHYVQRKKLDAEDYILYNSTYTKT
jgi:hypothetical protein